MFTRTRLVGLVMLFFATAVPTQAQTTLRYKFTPGDKLAYAVENKMSMKLDIGGKEMEMAVSQMMELAWNIESVGSDGKAMIQQKITRIQFAMDGLGGKLQYDSAEGKLPGGPLSDTAGPILKALSGLEVSLSMDPRGEIRDVKVPPAFLKTLKDNGGGVEDIFNEDAMKKMIGQASLAFPKEALAKGKTWNQKLSMKAPFGEMRMDNLYTYDGAVQKGDKKLEQISVRPTITLKTDDNVSAAMNLKDGGGKGVAYFDNDAGRLVEMNTTQNMTMEAAGQSIRLVQNISMKLKE